MRDYRLEQDTATFVRANSRVPEMMIGDLTAKAGVCHTIGEARLHDLIRTYGAPALLQQFDQAGERTAHRISEQLAAWPDGVCEVEAMVDDPSTGEPIRMHVASIKEGQRLVLDFTGTGDQATAPINLRPPFIEGLARNMAIRLTDRHIPLNHGMNDAVECRFRRGSLLDPAFPGPRRLLLQDPRARRERHRRGDGQGFRQAPPLPHIATQSSIVVGYTGAKRQYVQYELMYAGAPAWEGGDGFSPASARAPATAPSSPASRSSSPSSPST